MYIYIYIYIYSFFLFTLTFVFKYAYIYSIIYIYLYGTKSLSNSYSVVINNFEHPKYVWTTRTYSNTQNMLEHPEHFGRVPHCVSIILMRLNMLWVFKHARGVRTCRGCSKMLNIICLAVRGVPLFCAVVSHRPFSRDQSFFYARGVVGCVHQ